jgi:hypothetical protein
MDVFRPAVLSSPFGNCCWGCIDSTKCSQCIWYFDTTRTGRSFGKSGFKFKHFNSLRGIRWSCNFGMWGGHGRLLSVPVSKPDFIGNRLNWKTQKVQFFKSKAWRDRNVPCQEVYPIISRVAFAHSPIQQWYFSRDYFDNKHELLKIIWAIPQVKHPGLEARGHRNQFNWHDSS